MTQARDEALTQETRKQIAELESLGWYHSIELPDGSVLSGTQSIGRLRRRLSQFPIPDNLRGMRVLDVGAWDGWFSFELERRGAQVVALDLVQNPKFLLARDLLKSKVEYVVADICKVQAADLGKFDIVLFLGVLYHLKHPLLALEKVCALTTELACLESYVTDNGDDLGAPPALEFYEGTELRGQFDNWMGPNTPCLLAMARAAGFAVVKLEGVFDQRAHVTCHRKWQDEPGSAPPPTLHGVENTVSRDHDFSTQSSDDYVSVWFKSQRSDLCADNVRVEIGPYAARPVQVVQTSANGWTAVCKLPPGLAPGWHEIRVRTPGSQFSNTARIPVDLSLVERRSREFGPVSPTLKIDLVTDGRTWERWRVRAGAGSCLSIWALGIPDSCGLDQVSVHLDDMIVPATFVEETAHAGLRQVNAMIPAGIRTGPTMIRLQCSTAVSGPANIEFVR